MGVIKRQGIKNSVITYIGIIIGAVNVIFVQPRLLTEEELGLTRLLFDYAYLIGLLLPLGLPNIIVRYFPLYKDENSGHHGFAGLILTIFLVGFILASLALFSLEEEISSHYRVNAVLFVEYFKFLLPFTVIVSAIAVTTSYSQSLFKSTVPSFLNDIAVRLGIILVTILYFNKIINFYQYVIFFIGIYAIELLLIILFISVVDRPSLVPKKGYLKTRDLGSMIRFGLVLCIASFASYGLRKADAVILGTSSLGLVAVYTTAVFVAAFIEVPLVALERISHAKISASFATGNFIAIGRIYSESVRYLLLAGGFLFIGINACADHVYELGGLPVSYRSAINVVYIVALGSLVNVSTGVNSAIMFYSKYYLLGTILLILSLIVTVALNIFLIPIYGIYGAAIASVFGAVLYNLIKYTFIYSKFSFQPYNRRSFLIFLIIVFCTMIAHSLPPFLNQPLINILYKGGVVSALYFVLCHYLKVAPEIFSSVKGKLGGFLIKKNDD